MFALDRSDFAKKILDCAGGPASFNAGMTRAGSCVLSCDPLYEFSAAQIEARIQETYPAIAAGVAANRDDYVWTVIPSVEVLLEQRLAAMREFLADYANGREAGRYLPASLPDLPLGDRTYDLALCSHFLFSYSAHLDLAFHRVAIADMLRVAREVRVFPLLEVSGRPSPQVKAIVADCQQAGYGVSIETVPYEFQKGGNAMLRLVNP